MTTIRIDVSLHSYVIARNMAMTMTTTMITTITTTTSTTTPTGIASTTITITTITTTKYRAKKLFFSFFLYDVFRVTSVSTMIDFYVYFIG